MDGQSVEQPRALEYVADPGWLYAAAGDHYPSCDPFLIY